MRVVQHSVGSVAEIAGLAPQPAAGSDVLALVFGSAAHFADPALVPALRAALPGVWLAGCSTAGEIIGDGIREESCVITVLSFERTRVRVVDTVVADIDRSMAGGQDLGRALAAPDLAGVLVFGKGLAINGSALIEGLVQGVGERVPVSGGLAGDGGAFKCTWVLSPAGVSDQKVVAVGLYGEGLRLGHGSFGGWEPFGPTRKITRATGNILHELDGEPALNVYKRYLGDYARELPASGLLFPFEMLNQHGATVGLIRTILGIDEGTGSLILAGAVDENGFLRLMHASADALIDGAETAARTSIAGLAPGSGPGVALLVSCVGRKLVMGDQVDEEIAAVVEQLGADFTLTGFYSYGEICPLEGFQACKLHNQTMTVTLIAES
jgi:hypothetical protein